ncbi:TnsA-like heteromeric transposase endonuclease subunit [Paractinoplanes brasiliensis]|uniref:TnsA-like heteromeric transposase endonuclease subunit n=1 Tax=Paractinoplanes brasiliensis TaxID=52695 RepID=UPI0019428937|nr:TnsA-like heteromeric transposase endonuclease subunit [Actinoplanes brasiliensis]GID29145.1 hypothetical protein Abr02nite_41280 [Actinoplanes brasiliensis]
MESDLPWTSAPVEVMACAVPWRVFRWYRGQRHYSGYYWSSTQKQHVTYESRLELSHLISADFDPSVQGIVSQPFLLALQTDPVRRHVPDYLLVTSGNPIVIDVKPARYLDHPKIAPTLSWTREIVESRGWEYRVCTEPPPARMENVRFLAGYRRSWLIPQEPLARLRNADLNGRTLGEAFTCLPDLPEPYVRAAVLHLLWTGHLVTDLEQPLDSSQQIWERR